MKNKNNLIRNKIIAASIGISSLFVNYFISEAIPDQPLQERVNEINKVLDNEPTYNQLLDSNYMSNLEELYKQKIYTISSEQYKLEKSEFIESKQKKIPYIAINTILGMAAIVYLMRAKPKKPNEQQTPSQT